MLFCVNNFQICTGDLAKNDTLYLFLESHPVQCLGRRLDFVESLKGPRMAGAGFLLESRVFGAVRRIPVSWRTGCRDTGFLFRRVVRGRGSRSPDTCTA